MRLLRSIEVPRLRYFAAAAGIGLLAAFGGCSVLLDHGTTQCHTDSDCLSLGVQPSVDQHTCQSGVCVNTGITCFGGTPDASTQFLNHCTAGTCVPFDDCARLGVCGDDDPPDAVDPPPPDGGTQTATTLGAPSTYPNCADLPGGNGGPVYVTGSSNFPTFLANMTPLMWIGVPPTNVGPAVVFLTTSSCQGADAIFSADAAANVIHDPPDGSAASAYAQYSLQSGETIPCLLGDAGAHVDVGESDVYSTTCNMSYTTTMQTDTPGPIQAMEFVVPQLSNESAISEEAAREVFGLGGNDGGATPWTNPARYYVRNKNTGTQQMIGDAIKVSPAEFWGIDRGTATNVHDELQLLSSSPDEAQQAIGILSDDVYDSDRNNLKVLAYKAKGQNCAYLPDSTATTYDKQNVRDGHYPIWGPVHFFTKNGPSSQVQAFVNYFNGAQNAPAILDAFIGANLIPNCAMTVLRSGNAELSDLVSYMPEHSCACYFLATVGPPALPDGGEPGPPPPLPPECTKCTFASDCPASRPACNFGYCELQ